VIDFAGPWEVFQDVHVPERGSDMDEMMPFRLFTVSETTKPLRGSAGLQLVPDYTFENAPQPRVIVVGAQRGSDALHAWLRKASEQADLTMSVCTGAFHLAKAGLLSGKAATTHHDLLDRLAKQFPDVEFRRGLRFVESSPKLATAGGLSSGIDLALRVVERYFGRPTAERTAAYMEYQGRGWVV
jgi:transcriptional regulator GlxA family with amidase domain